MIKKYTLITANKMRKTCYETISCGGLNSVI